MSPEGRPDWGALPDRSEAEGNHRAKAARGGIFIAVAGSNDTRRQSPARSSEPAKGLQWH